VTKVQGIFKDISKTSISIVGLGTAASIYFAGRACCSSKLSTGQRVGNLMLAFSFLGAAAYETYANGVNLGHITPIHA
jgi:hypothetical protein